MLRKVLIAFLIVFISLGCSSCDLDGTADYGKVESSLQRATQRNRNLTQELSDKKKEFRSFSTKQISDLFEMAKIHDSIKSYELFLKSVDALPTLSQGDDKTDSLKRQAIHRIYELTRQADLIEGYQYYLRNYKDTPEVKDVNRRIYEIFYKISEKQNTLPAYLLYVSEFKGAPEDLRDKALGKAVSLECQSLNEKYNEIATSLIESKYKNDEVISNLLRQGTIDRIGNELFEDAIEARESGDEVTFSEKFNAVFECSLFKDSNKRYEFRMNEDLRNELKRIQGDLTKIRKDIAQSRAVILSKLDGIDEKLDQQDLYVQKLTFVVEEQSKLLEGLDKPFSWDEGEGVWDNFVRLGLVALDVVQTAGVVLESPAAMALMAA